MKKLFRLFLVLLLPLFPFAQAPSWSVNPNDYQYTSTLTGVLIINDTIINTPNNVLGAFVNGQVRGVATPIQVNGTKMYFITLYSNTSNGEIFDFKAYIDVEDSVHNILDSITYTSSSVYGDPSAPYELFLNFEDDPYFQGLPSLSTLQSQQFDSIKLSDYVVNPLGVAVDYSILHVGTNLSAYLSGDTLIVTHQGAIGLDSVQVGLVDSLTPSIVYDSAYWVYEVIADNTPIAFDGIENQLWGNNSVPCIDLSAYLENLDNDVVEWEVQVPLLDSIGDSVVNWSVVPSTFQYSMNVIAEAFVNGTRTVGSNFLLSAFEGVDARGVTSPIQVGSKWLYFLTIYSNTASATIDFKLYNGTDSIVLQERSLSIQFSADSSLGEISAPLDLSFGAYNYSFENGLLCFELFDSIPGLIDTVTVIATESNTQETFSDTVSFTINYFDENQPYLDGVMDQSIIVGSVFTSFDLDDYLTELDGDAVIYSVLDTNNVSIQIDGSNTVSIIPNDPLWIGSDTIRFKVSDDTPNGLYDYATVVYKVKPMIDVFGVLDQTITSSQSFTAVDLINHLDYAFPDSVVWEITSSSLIPVVQNHVMSMYFPNGNWFGSDTIYVKAMNVNNHGIYDIDTAVYTVINTSSIEDNESINLSVFPNPVRNKLTISSDKGMEQLYIYSSDGALVWNEKINTNLYELSTETLPSGMYVIKGYFQNGVFTRIFVKE